MERTEIRYRKKPTLVFLAILALSMIGAVYVIYLSGRYDGYMKGVYVIVLGWMALAIYRTGRPVFKNEPILTFTKEAIVFGNPDKGKQFLWSDITACRVETSDNTRYLSIVTPGKKKKINISWLDKTPDEIEQMIASLWDQKMNKNTV